MNLSNSTTAAPGTTGMPLLPRNTTAIISTTTKTPTYYDVHIKIRPPYICRPELAILLSRMMFCVAFHTKATFSVLVASVTWQ